MTRPVRGCKPGRDGRSWAAVSIRRYVLFLGPIRALAANHLGEAAYAEAAREFNYVTPENEMKWDVTEPTRGNFAFTLGDQIVDFAEENDMAVKEHTLLWHNQLPQWLLDIDDPTDLRACYSVKWMCGFAGGTTEQQKRRFHDIIEVCLAEPSARRSPSGARRISTRS